VLCIAVVWWWGVGKGKNCECRTSDGQVFWVGGPYESCKEAEAWEREATGKKVWCYEDVF
jgi:hypothetical protein